MSRRAKTGVLVTLAVAVAVACMVGLSAQAVVSRASCTNNPVLVNVAVNNDITPAIQTIARGFNNGRHTAGGRCVQVQVTTASSAAVAGQVEGRSSVTGLGSIGAWIPDSSLWVDLARRYPQGAQSVMSANITVARSPVMIVATSAVTGRFDEPLGWNDLLPPNFGGPPASLGLTVDMPDPAESGVGLDAVVETSREVSREFGNGATAREAFEAFVHDSDSTLDTDSAGALQNFASTHTSSGSGGAALTVASEQAVLQYDKITPGKPLNATYPSGPSSSLGTPELDYPYVVISGNRAEEQAAEAFGKYLQTPYAQSAVRYYGFRSANGVADVLPSSDGLSSQPLQPATASAAAGVAATLKSWQTLSGGARDLALIDVSPATRLSDGDGSTLEQLIALSAEAGLADFKSGGTHMGDWIVGQSKSPSQPYESQVRIGSLTASVGVMSRREQFNDLLQGLKPSNGNLLLNDAIWDAYKYMTHTYAPNEVNVVLLLTAGVDGTHDMPLSQLLANLKGLYNPERKVSIIVLMFGRNGNFTALKQVAKDTGGLAFQVTSPSQMTSVFLKGVANDLCDQGCAGP